MHTRSLYGHIPRLNKEPNLVGEMNVCNRSVIAFDKRRQQSVWKVFAEAPRLCEAEADVKKRIYRIKVVVLCGALVGLSWSSTNKSI